MRAHGPGAPRRAGCRAQTSPLPRAPRAVRAPLAAPATESHGKRLQDELLAQCLDELEQSAPDNALADYLSAQNQFESGRADNAVRDLIAAAGKSGWQDYLLEQIQNTEEAYRMAGYSEAEAKLAATVDQSLAYCGRLNELVKTMTVLAGQYRQAGDEASAQAILQMGLDMSRRLGDNSGQLFIVPGSVGKFIGISLQDVTPAPAAMSWSGVDNARLEVTVVPEPGTLALLGRQPSAGR